MASGLNLSLLVMDNSYPVADAFNATNTAGTVRFISSADGNTVAAAQRQAGDFVTKCILLQNKINSVIAALQGVPQFNDMGFVKTDGSRPFAAPVSGIDPTAANHLATKSYVDASSVTINTTISNLTDDYNTFKTSTPGTYVSAWTLLTWNPGAPAQVDITVPGSYTFDNLRGAFIIFKIDTAVPTLAVPNPPPSYIYKIAVPGGQNGILIDDFWCTDANQVHVLIPYTSFYPSYPAPSDYIGTTQPRSISIKVVVMATQS